MQNYTMFLGIVLVAVGVIHGVGSHDLSVAAAERECPKVTAELPDLDRLFLGSPNNEASGDAKTARRFVESIPVKGMPASLQQRVEMLREQNWHTGIAAIYTHGVFQAVADEFKPVEATTDITHFEWNPDDGSGCLHAKTSVTWSSNGETEKARYRWQARIEPGGFKLVPRAEDDRSNPFPNTIPLADQFRQRVWEEGLKFKLFAQGRKIKVDHVAYRGPDDSKFKDIDPSHPGLGHIYDRSKNNCIDLMFTRRPPTSLTADEVGEDSSLFGCVGSCGAEVVIQTM